LSKGFPGGEVAVKWKVRDCTALAKFKYFNSENCALFLAHHNQNLSCGNVNIDHDSSRWPTTIEHVEMESLRLTEAEVQVLQDPSVPSPEMPGHKLDNPEM
jgi:ribosomal protein S27AE